MATVSRIETRRLALRDGLSVREFAREKYGKTEGAKIRNRKSAARKGILNPEKVTNG